MICKKCGAEMLDDAKVCNSCGAESQQPQNATCKMCLSDFFNAIRAELKRGPKLLHEVWCGVLDWQYELFDGVAPEDHVTIFDVFAALKSSVARKTRKQKRIFAAGAAVLLLLMVCTVNASIPTSQGSSGGNGGIWISSRQPYQPEFSKLDCLTCRGDGDCNTCNGYGEVERYAGAGDTVRAKCSSCYGSGNCRTCGGSGKR